MKFRRQYHRQLRWLLTFHNPADVVVGLPIGVASTGAIAHEAPGFRLLAIGEDRRRGIARHQHHQLHALAEKNGSELTMSARTCCCFMVTKASCSCPNVLACRIRSRCPRAVAAASKDLASSTLGGFVGLISVTITLPSGTSSRARSSRLVTTGEV